MIVSCSHNRYVVNAWNVTFASEMTGRAEERIDVMEEEQSVILYLFTHIRWWGILPTWDNKETKSIQYIRESDLTWISVHCSSFFFAKLLKLYEMCGFRKMAKSSNFISFLWKMSSSGITSVFLLLFFLCRSGMKLWLSTVVLYVQFLSSQPWTPVFPLHSINTVLYWLDYKKTPSSFSITCFWVKTEDTTHLHERTGYLRCY